MSTKIQLRRDTAVNWTASNPVLAIGEIGVVTSGSTIVNMRMGDGVTAFNSLSLLKLSFFNADDMVKTVHLQANSVTSAKLLSDVATDANRAVTSDHIKDVAVTTAKIAGNAVTSAKLLSDASVNANRAVESNHIKDSQVITRTIADDNVTYAKIQNVTATDKLLGRSTAGAGDIEEIACTPFARTILDDVAAVNVRTTIGAKENITEPVTTGGTGATSLAAGNVLLGNGTSAVAVVAPSTSGNVLVSNGSTWVSATSITANTSGNAATATTCTGNSATATTAGTVTTAAQPNITSCASLATLGTLTSFVTTRANANATMSNVATGTCTANAISGKITISQSFSVGSSITATPQFSQPAATITFSNNTVTTNSIIMLDNNKQHKWTVTSQSTGSFTLRAFEENFYTVLLLNGPNYFTFLIVN